MQIVVVLPTQAEVRHVGVRDDDRACSLEMTNDRGILFGGPVLEADDPHAGRRTADIDAVLDSDRNAVEGSRCGAGIGCICRGKRLLSEHGRKCIDLGVDRPDSIEVRLDDLTA